MVQGRTGSGNIVPLMVRVPEDLRDRIKAAADANGRSQNSEIVVTLEEKYPAPGSSFEMAELVKRVAYVQAAQNAEDQRNRVDEVNAWLHQRDQSVSIELRGEPDERGMQDIHFSVN